MNLYIYKYNNYYNRIVKKEDTLADYGQYLYLLENTNFVPNDGVNTQHVIGSGDYNGEGDYLIAVDDNNNIVSRWFIVESVRTRAGQWNLVLHRDLIVDHYDQVIDAPMYIEKATLSENDPAIWNNEGVSVNQIKTNEYTLQDDSRCAWICGYFNKTLAEKEMEIEYNNPVANITTSSLSDFLSDNKAYKLNSKWMGFKFSIYQAGNSGAWNTEYDAYFHKVYGNYLWELIPTGTVVSGGINSYDGFIWIGPGQIGLGIENALKEKQNLLNNLPNSTILNQMEMYFNTGHSYDYNKFNEILKLNGKTLNIAGTNNFYKVTVEREVRNHRVTIDSDLNVINGIPSLKTYLNQQITGLKGTPKFEIMWSEESIKVVANPIYFGNTTITFPGESNRLHLNDAPYDMFCIPYKKGGLNIEITDTKGKYGATFTSMDTLQALSVASSIVELLGKDNVYDLQLLPYCPLEGWEADPLNNNRFKYICDRVSETGNGLAAKDLIYIASENLIIFFSTSSQGTYNSEQLHLVNTETNEEVSLPLQLGNKKIANECDMYRLCSPNYNGQFEFNASKIDGLTGFNVDYTYLPYSPYIHVNPNFSGLYGKDFDDARGLVCQGDFSISYLSDAWVNYQVQNKNYANIFNRLIENMEVNQDIERKQQVFNATVGTIMGGAGGAVAGAKGGLPGIIAGALVGTAAGAVGGALDVKYGDILRAEALDYTKDMYNYQLDNIKALPDSLAKVTAYTKNNKIFPILEYYTCTDIEKKAIANKIAWNGMTVMRIGSMLEFIGNNWEYDGITSKGYIKGKLIRLDTVNDDYHIVNALSGELDKGVFIK